MLYEVAIKNKISGDIQRVSVEAENRPIAVQMAMHKVHEMLQPPTHLVTESICLHKEGA